MAGDNLTDFASIVVSPEVSRARESRSAIVALESALITHGLPFPQNIGMARALESAIRDEGAKPATIGVVDGQIHAGLSSDELDQLANSRSSLKLSVRDLPTAIVRRSTGGTTVAATIFIASKLGIAVFATGGLGGVHRENSTDISADLQILADTPMIVVCAGAKAILDLPATLEYLETMSVPVVGYGTDEFPAFYSRGSGLPVSLRLDSPQGVAEFWAVHRSLNLRSALVLANPIPQASAIPRTEIEPVIAQAVAEARDREIHGQALTPFLLARLSELTSGRSLRSNQALLLSNARLAAQISVAIAVGNPAMEKPS